jgi:outer membrane receptor for ferrienterochelin and colicins
MTRWRRPLALAVALGAGGAISAWSCGARADEPAADDLAAILDEPLVGGASKTTEVTSAAPAMTTIITADELRRYGIRSLDEAINFLSVGMEAQTPLTAAEVGARGVLLTQDYGNHILLLLDGHALNEPWGGTAYFDRGAAIPLEVIDHIEIILGPGSVLYGSNAMLGVINVVTKRARDYRGMHVVAESEVLPTGEGVGSSFRGGVGAGYDFDVGQKESGEIVFAAELYRLNGQPFAFGPQDYGDDAVTGAPRVWSDQTAPGVWGGVARETYFANVPTAFVHLRLADFHLRARAALFERSHPYHLGDFDDPTNTERDRWLNLDASYRTPLGSKVELFARLYADLYDYQQLFPSSAPEDCLPGQDGCLYDLVGVARWTGLELNATYDWFGDARYTTLLGADGRLKHIGSTIDLTDLETGEGPPIGNDVDEDELAVGVYLQQTLRPVDPVGLNAGVRLDLDDRYGAHVSPRGAANFATWKGAAFKVIYAEAFRAPTAFERYYADPTSQVAPDDLLPEIVRGVETSFEQRFGAQRLEIGGFASFWEDLVLTEDLSDEEVADAIARGQLEDGVEFAQQTRNAGSIDSFGFTARFDGSAAKGKLRYAASLTRARSRRTDPLTAAPVELGAASQLFGNARVSYDFSDGAPVLALASRFSGPRPSNDEDSGGTTAEAPGQLELRATVSGTFPGVSVLTYRLTGSHAFHDRYPYSVGPAFRDDGTSELAPVDQTKIAIGLGVDLDP